MSQQEQHLDKQHLLEWAWGIIANAGDGDWKKETPEWQLAAAKWRDAWFQITNHSTSNIRPTLQSCPHNTDSWCLSCVSKAMNTIENQDKLLQQIYNICARPASNYRLMQIAEPARRIRNLIRPHLYKVTLT